MLRSCWALLLLGLLSTSVAAEPYQLDGLRLGMALDELRRSPAIGAGNRVICNIDRDADELRPQPEYLPPRTGGSRAAPACGIYRYGSRVERATTLPAEWHPARFRFGQIDIFPQFQFVAADGEDKTYRLVSITVRTNVGYWNTIVGMLTSRFGQPSSRERPEGGFPDNAVLGWDNGDSTIRVVRRVERFHRSILTFEHKGLAALMRFRAARGAPLP